MKVVRLTLNSYIFNYIIKLFLKCESESEVTQSCPTL